MTELTPRLPTSDQLDRLEHCFPERIVKLANGAQLSVRESGTAPTGVLPLVCLHGIGSGSASWLEAAQTLSRHTRLIAWDAPGYGSSTPLPMDVPKGIDYAQRLHELLDELGVSRCVVVGHSLGALMAAPATSTGKGSERFAALVLVSPARGYGAQARAADAARVRTQRLGALDELGIAGMAEKRSSRLVSEHASSDARAWVRWNMARLKERGYRQAVELLCGDDLLTHLPAPVPSHVACGALDVVTPPSACLEVAQAAGVELHPIPDAGHASYVEQPQIVAEWLGEVLNATISSAHSH